MYLYLYFFISVFILFFVSYSYAECVINNNYYDTTIECERTQSGFYKLQSITENKQETNIIPMYTDNSIYLTVETRVINVNSSNHTLNIGNKNSSINPRIDVNITNFISKAENETINIYGIDNLLNPSVLQIGSLEIHKGDLYINANHKNKVYIKNATVNGNFYLSNVESNLYKIQANNLYIDNSVLNILNTGTIDVVDIFLNNNSSIFISASGKISSIQSLDTSYNNLIFSGDNTVLNIGSIVIDGGVTLKNNVDIYIDNTITANEINFLGSGSFVSNFMKINKMNFYNSNSFIKSNFISANNINIINSDINIFSNSLVIKNQLTIDGSNFAIYGNADINTFLIKDSTIINDGSLRANSLLLNNSEIKLNNLQLNNRLILSDSLLKVESFNFISFAESPFIGITSNSKVFSQGDLTTGIYSDGHVNISNNVQMNLILLDSYKIQQGDTIITELIYSKDGKIYYSPEDFGLNNDNDILKIKYLIIEEKGTSFVAEITRVISYCQVLFVDNLCNENTKVGYRDDTFVADTAKNFDKFIEEKIPVTENISNLISRLDYDGGNKLENNLISLKPISNDVLLFESYQNSKFIKDLYHDSKNEKYNLSFFTSTGKINDHLFINKSKTQLFGAYYKTYLTKNLGIGVSLNKSNIDNSLYSIDNLGFILLSSYFKQINSINLDLITSYYINKYDMNKTNFNNNKATSSSLLNNFSFRGMISQNYFIRDIKFSPNFYYDISYLLLNDYKEIGDGYLYEVLSNKSLVQEFAIGVDLSKNILNDKSLIFVNSKVLYFDFSLSSMLAKPYEAMDEYINFGNASYSGFGISYVVGIQYNIKENIDVSIAYKGYIYQNSSTFNGLKLSINL